MLIATKVEGRAGSGLKPEVKVAIGGDRQPGSGGDVVTLEDMREFMLLSRSTSSRCVSQTKMGETGC